MEMVADDAPVRLSMRRSPLLVFVANGARNAFVRGRNIEGGEAVEDWLKNGPPAPTRGVG